MLCMQSVSCACMFPPPTQTFHLPLRSPPPNSPNNLNTGRGGRRRHLRGVPPRAPRRGPPAPRPDLRDGVAGVRHAARRDVRAPPRRRRRERRAVGAAARDGRVRGAALRDAPARRVARGLLPGAFCFVIKGCIAAAWARASWLYGCTCRPPMFACCMALHCAHPDMQAHAHCSCSPTFHHPPPTTHHHHHDPFQHRATAPASARAARSRRSSASSSTAAWARRPPTAACCGCPSRRTCATTRCATCAMSAPTTWRSSRR